MLTYVLVFLAGYITHALISNPKVRSAAVYIFTFRWVRIGISAREETHGKFKYHVDPKKTPKGYKRVWPPPAHSGGPVEQEIDIFVLSRLKENISIDQAWQEATTKFYPESVKDDAFYLKGEFNNMKRRIARRRHQN